MRTVSENDRNPGKGKPGQVWRLSRESYPELLPRRREIRVAPYWPTTLATLISPPLVVHPPLIREQPALRSSNTRRLEVVETAPNLHVPIADHLICCWSRGVGGVSPPLLTRESANEPLVTLP